LKEETLDGTMWRARFGRGFGPVVRQTAKWKWIKFLCYKLYCNMILLNLKKQQTSAANYSSEFVNHLLTLPKFTHKTSVTLSSALVLNLFISRLLIKYATWKLQNHEGIIHERENTVRVRIPPPSRLSAM
jgi:hypothetical protein